MTSKKISLYTFVLSTTSILAAPNQYYENNPSLSQVLGSKSYYPSELYQKQAAYKEYSKFPSEVSVENSYEIPQQDQLPLGNQYQLQKQTPNENHHQIFPPQQHKYYPYLLQQYQQSRIQPSNAQFDYVAQKNRYPQVSAPNKFESIVQEDKSSDHHVLQNPADSQQQITSDSKKMPYSPAGSVSHVSYSSGAISYSW